MVVQAQEASPWADLASLVVAQEPLGACQAALAALAVVQEPSAAYQAAQGLEALVHRQVGADR